MDATMDRLAYATIVQLVVALIPVIVDIVWMVKFQGLSLPIPEDLIAFVRFIVGTDFDTEGIRELEKTEEEKKAEADRQAEMLGEIKEKGSSWDKRLYALFFMFWFISLVCVICALVVAQAETKFGLAISGFVFSNISVIIGLVIAMRHRLMLPMSDKLLEYLFKRWGLEHPADHVGVEELDVPIHKVGPSRISLSPCSDDLSDWE